MRQSAAMRCARACLFLMLSACATVPAQPRKSPCRRSASRSTGTATSAASPRALPIPPPAAPSRPTIRSGSRRSASWWSAIGVMKLVEQGKLDLDEDVSRQARLDPAQPGLSRPADHASPAAVAHQLGPRLRGSICDPARRLGAGDHGRADQLGSEARARRRLFHLLQPQLPDRRVDRRARDRRAVRPVDAPRGASSR